MKRVLLASRVACMIGLLVFTIPMRAHHGTSAYDPAKTLKLKGTVTSFEWVNPHASLAWDVKTENGGVEHWVVELTSPGMLTRSGWHHDSAETWRRGHRILSSHQERDEVGNFPAGSLH